MKGLKRFGNFKFKYGEKVKKDICEQCVQVIRKCIQGNPDFKEMEASELRRYTEMVELVQRLSIQSTEAMLRAYHAWLIEQER
ncbi:MAG: hypothetical protein RR588_12560 [Solibacillus sp.]